MHSEKEVAEILLVEDNPGDVELTRETLEGCAINVHLSVASDGVEALAHLRREGAYREAPRPDIILLDLNLPRKSGREVLEEIKQDPELKHIPVIVLTTSVADQDVLAAYSLHANGYIAKPARLDEFTKAIRSIESFWLSVAKLPPTLC